MDLFASNFVLILCFVVGTALIVLEGFMPGFGIAGISGLILEVIAVLMVGGRFGLVPAIFALLGVLLVVGIAFWISYRSAMKGRLSKTPLILRDTEKADAAAAAPAEETGWIGKTAVTVTPLRPAGTVEADGERMTAASGGEFIEKGKTVTVIGREGNKLLVREADA